jgi:hypothetical protein
MCIAVQGEYCTAYHNGDRVSRAQGNKYNMDIFHYKLEQFISTKYPFIKHADRF